MRYLPHILSVVVLAAFAGFVDAAPSHSSHKGMEKHVPVKRLSKTHHRIVYKGNPYYFSGGRFYRRANGVYVTIAAPIGAVVPTLPGGFVTIGAGPARYFYFGGVYYRAVADGYVVINKPAEAPESLPVTQDTGRIIIYPASGQSEEQMGRDRYECHLWASKETGFDPTSSSSEEALQEEYNRAMSACLEARDYVVK